MIEFVISAGTLDLIYRAILCCSLIIAMILFGCMGYALYLFPQRRLLEKKGILIVIICGYILGITTILLISGMVSVVVV